MNNANDRLDEILAYTKKSYNSLSKKIGLKRSQNLYDIRDGKVKSISLELSTLIKTAYPEFNLEWLQYGNGDMISGTSSITTKNPVTIDLPLISVPSRASFNYEVFQDNSMLCESAPIYRIAVKGLKKPVLIDIDGDSMTPQLAPGTRVLADEIDPNDWNYITGVVAVSFKNQFVVKRIKENHSIETNFVVLYSDNEKGGSFPVRLEDINAIWKVLEIVKAKVE